MSRWLTAVVVAGQVEPEHGTNGYQHALPYTKVEVADLWVVNNFIKDREKARMQLLPYWRA